MMRRQLLAGISAFLILAALPGIPTAAAGDEWTVRVEGRLPEGNYRASSVSTGGEVLIFGGRNGERLSSSVMRYDIESHSTSYAPYRLPQPRMSSCAVFDGTRAYVFGGSDGGLELDTILMIAPATGQVRTLEAMLPSPRIGLSAALQGGCIYIFGGHSNGTKIIEVLRFDPNTGNLSAMSAKVPSGRAGMAIASTPKGIYLFGGKTDPGASDEVLLYEPEADRLSVLPDRLPYTVYHAPAVEAGGKVLIIGGNAQLAGWEVSRSTDTVIVFDPATGKSEVSGARLPSPRERMVAACIDGKVVVFGGQEGTRALEEVVVLSLGDSPDDGRGQTLPVVGLIVILLVIAVALLVMPARRR